MNAKIKLVIAIAIAAVAIIFSYFQISDYFRHHHEMEAQRQAIQKSVAENTEGASELLDLQIHSGSTTYAELFEREDDRIKKISDAIIPVGVSSLPDTEKDALKQYLQKTQELLRLQVAEKRKELAVSTSLEIAKQASDDYRSSVYNPYSSNFEQRHAQKTLDEAKKAMTELGTAGRDFAEKLKAFQVDLKKWRPALKDYSLIEDRQIIAVIGVSENKQK